MLIRSQDKMSLVKFENIVININNMKVTGIYNGEYFKAGGKPPSYKIGWNDCIDTITGGNSDD